jgi:hypothetical protein
MISGIPYALNAYSQFSALLDYQWIYASSKFVNQVNRNWEDWRNQETLLLGVVSVSIQFIK